MRSFLNFFDRFMSPYFLFSVSVAFGTVHPTAKHGLLGLLSVFSVARCPPKSYRRLAEELVTHITDRMDCSRF